MSTAELLWQPSLFGAEDAVEADLSFAAARRTTLSHGAWIDEVPDWAAGHADLFDELRRTAPWQEAERPMYDRIVAVPRLHTGVWSDPPARLRAMAQVLGDHYGCELPNISANLYRDGNDSVAWHGDRVGRVRADTVVAILTLGSPRRLLLRPNGGGRSLAVEPGPGDLFVMGGTCQRTWQHSVPKRAQAGPRVCVMFREPGGN
ncbi:alpha-ketoglutarate-dependent dioxygenase AlkB [Actinomarinicola tropica]|uniref:Alpha-ketoglutarate-dependent dioxygenase AlkB n=1 Tax=Actinomarinicola tropica TaxID=2789776 RepID=A0A5Q2RI25_9ACTN|nr:alpha-ketoglutarate-dependent dioxygenase AlkB [Actinomarinicola tropica]QGG96518.1 alpha-ketoglutarate-dependent dioxygenase AlkB [Actinomarinicola tropica]